MWHQQHISWLFCCPGGLKAQSKSKQEVSKHQPSQQEPAKQEPCKHQPSQQDPGKHESSKHQASKHQLSKHDCSVSKELTDRLSKPKAAQASAEPAAVAATAAGPCEEGAAADPLSTLSYLMKAMSPEQLQEVLQGLKESGNSIVPAEVPSSLLLLCCIWSPACFFECT